MVHDVTEMKALLVQAADMLFSMGVMQFSGHGNLSARLDADRMVITSRGTIRGLTSDDFAVVTLDGAVVDGRLDPTNAEIVRMHTSVYGARADAGAVIHTHSPYTTAFALAHEPLPCVYEAVLRQGVAEEIPVADWAPRGSEESVSNIVARLEAHPTVPAVLLANHGLLASGRDPLGAAGFIVAMEESALLTLHARLLGGAKAFPADALDREQRHMARFGSRR